MPKSRISLWSLTLATLLAAGCAAPATTPTMPAEQAPPAPPAPQAAAQAPAVPVSDVPDPAFAAMTASTTTFSGQARFGEERLADYPLQVLDARTGQPLPVASNAAGVALGQPTVVGGTLRTDAEGRFSLNVAGLVPGQALRLVAAKGNATLELVVSAEAARGPLQAGGELQLDVLSTALAKISRGVLEASAVVPPAEAAPIVAKLMVKLAALRQQLEPTLAANPGLLRWLIESRDLRGATEHEASAVRLLVGQGAALRELSLSIAELLRELAELAKARHRPTPALVQALREFQLIGTVLKAQLGPDGSFTVTNVHNGRQADVCNGDVESVCNTGSSRVHHGSSSPSPTPKPTSTPSEEPQTPAHSTYELVAPACVTAPGPLEASDPFPLLLRPVTVGAAGYEHLRVVFTLVSSPEGAEAGLTVPDDGCGCNLLAEGAGPAEGMAFGPEQTLGADVRFTGTLAGEYCIKAEVVDVLPGGGVTVLSTTTFKVTVAGAPEDQ